MELNQLKSAWQGMGGPNKNNEELRKMLQENRHPVLKGIRLQMIIENNCLDNFSVCLLRHV